MREFMKIVENVDDKTFKEPHLEYDETNDEYHFYGYGVWSEMNGKKGKYVWITSFHSNAPGQGNARKAIIWLKKHFNKIGVSDPGYPDENLNSFMFWKKLCSEGLIDTMQDPEGWILYLDGQWHIREDEADRYEPGFPEGLPALTEYAQPERVTGPDWFEKGHRVNVQKECPDADYILEGDEWDFEWRFCEVPAYALEHIVGHDWDRFVDGFARWGAPEETARFNKIEKWMQPNPVGRMHQRPPLILIDPASKEIRILDGNHRVGLAIHKFGMTSVPAVVAIGEATDA